MEIWGKRGSGSSSISFKFADCHKTIHSELSLYALRNDDIALDHLCNLSTYIRTLCGFLVLHLSSGGLQFFSTLPSSW